VDYWALFFFSSWTKCVFSFLSSFFFLPSFFFFLFFLIFLFSLLFGVECGYIRLGVNTSSFLVSHFIISSVTIYLMSMAMTQRINFDDNIKLLFAGSIVIVTVDLQTRTSVSILFDPVEFHNFSVPLSSANMVNLG
jgi:hypothetical protein